MVNLTPESERILEREAAREGVSVDTLIRRTFAPDAENSTPTNPHAHVQKLLADWQRQDDTPTAPFTPSPGRMTPSETLFRKWDEEDSQMSEADRTAQAEQWQQFQQDINTERAAAGMRLIF